MKEFISNQPEYSDARGVHEAALASSEEIYVTRADIGRHNAIDKVIGASLDRRNRYVGQNTADNRKGLLRDIL